jgi:diguanylate cyclase (GGDEF)-like protein
VAFVRLKRGVTKGDRADNILATRITAILALLAAAVIAATAYAGYAMNESALRIESGAIAKEANRMLVSTLDQQKSVALWDEAVRRVDAQDRPWIEAEIAAYLNQTYGHDRIVVIGRDGEIVYSYGKAKAGTSDAALMARAAPLLTEIRGGAKRPWRKSDGGFRPVQSDGTALPGAALLKAGASVLRIDGDAGIIAAMTIRPTHALALGQGKPAIILSYIRMTPRRIATLGENVNVQGLFALRTDDYQPLGMLDWNPHHPGRFFLVWLLPFLILVAIGGVIAGRYSVARTIAISRKLRRTAEAANRLALVDQVSDLPNRRAFNRALARALRDPANDFVIAIIDIDRFKDINDTMGHIAGDRLVRSVGQRLRGLFGPDAHISRLGGDEFAVIAPAVDAQARAQFRRTLQRAFRSKFNIGEGGVPITASIGTTARKHPQDSAEQLLREADIALYAAKERGRNCIVSYTEPLGAARRRNRTIEVDMEAAIENGQLYLAYQPIVSVADGSVREVEALARWRHPELGDIAPSDFIPVAEQTGQMDMLGRWAIAQATTDLAQIPGIDISINVSPNQLRSSRFLRDLVAVCRQHGLAPRRLMLEITEGVAFDTSSRSRVMVEALRATGFRIALDDFGSGYASLAILRSFPFDRLKLDRSLLLDVDSDTVAASVLEASIGIGQRLGMEIVAEGIETAAQARHMTIAGCTHLQGFLFSQPLDLAGLRDFLAAPPARRLAA